MNPTPSKAGRMERRARKAAFNLMHGSVYGFGVVYKTILDFALSHGKSEYRRALREAAKMFSGDGQESLVYIRQELLNLSKGVRGKA